MISVPAYLAAGLPPHLALGNNKFSSTFGTLFATARFLRHGMIDLPVAICSAVCALLGSFLGTRTVLLINPGFLNYILLVMIPLIALLTLTNKSIGRSDRSGSIPVPKKLVLGTCAGLVIGFYDGFFGPGTGTLLIIFYAVLLRYDFVRANGNTKVVNLASNVASVMTFLAFGRVQFALAIPAAICGIAGNLVGSRLVVKNGGRIIRPVFLIALCLLFAKIIYDVIFQSLH